MEIWEIPVFSIGTSIESKIKHDNSKIWQPQNLTNPKLDDHKTWQPQNSTTPKHDDPKTSKKQVPTTAQFTGRIISIQ